MKARYPIVFFDFDGTLAQSGEGIMLSFQYMLEQMGRPPMAERELRRLVGPPMLETFGKTLGFQGEEMDRAVNIYREWLNIHGMETLKLFPGVVEMLKTLREAGIKTAVATCKTETVAVAHADYLGIAPHLDALVGLCPDVGRKEKIHVLRQLLDYFHAQPDQVVLVGDRKYDCEGAIAAGIPCIGVLYGYGEREELAAYNPVYLASSVGDLQRYLLGE